jgi:hypothetical protein
MASEAMVRAGCLLTIVAMGCATSTQSVRIECVPEEVSIYVDGRLLEARSDELLLRTDAPHKIFVKGPGYEPRLVVLEPELDTDGRLHFSSSDLCVEVVPIGQDRELELEVEREAP